MDKICVVFVCNKLYFDKFLESCRQLIEIGKYKDDICLIIGDDLKDYNFNEDIFKNNNIEIKYFPDLDFGEKWMKINNTIKNQFRRKVWAKKFQFHKFYIFHEYCKKWNYILYIDCGMNIYSNIQPILDEKKEGVLFANRDGVDNETKYGGLPLFRQFLKNDKIKEQNEIFTKLKNNYNLYTLSFQTTLLLFDTNLIKKNTMNELIALNKEYPISRNNDQGIIGLYFYKKWKQLKRKNDKIYFYDFVKCVNEPYIMTKKTTGRYKHIGYLNDN